MRFRKDSKWSLVVRATSSMNIGCSSCLCRHSLKVMPCFPLSLYLRIKLFECQTHRQHSEGPLPIFAAPLENSISKHYSFIRLPGSCCKFSGRTASRCGPSAELSNPVTLSHQLLPGTVCKNPRARSPLL